MLISMMKGGEFLYMMIRNCLSCLYFRVHCLELTWSSILSKMHIFREVFMDFDPLAVSKLNEKMLITHGSVASSLLSELKLQVHDKYLRLSMSSGHLTGIFGVL